MTEAKARDVPEPGDGESDPSTPPRGEEHPDDPGERQQSEQQSDAGIPCHPSARHEHTHHQQRKRHRNDVTAKQERVRLARVAARAELRLKHHHPDQEREPRQPAIEDEPPQLGCGEEPQHAERDRDMGGEL